mmetsp:Transcript_34301/g.78641  ORF Transcript_34301/g.78641 Transcript_34301/m.78641 type:complete len:165 (-) Transcript_34301:1-495(-)
MGLFTLCQLRAFFDDQQGYTIGERRLRMMSRFIYIRFRQWLALPLLARALLLHCEDMMTAVLHQIEERAVPQTRSAERTQDVATQGRRRAARSSGSAATSLLVCSIALSRRSLFLDRLQNLPVASLPLATHCSTVLAWTLAYEGNDLTKLSSIQANLRLIPEIA